jgi:hypothetical protein
VQTFGKRLGSARPELGSERLNGGGGAESTVSIGNSSCAGPSGPSTRQVIKPVTAG